MKDREEHYEDLHRSS